MHILIDGDPIVYRNGVAGEDRTYEIIVRDLDTEELDALIFEDGNEKNEWVRAHKETHEVVDQECIRLPRPVTHALGPIKRTLESVQNEVASRFGLRRKDISFQIYLTGSGNFRERIAKEKEYKGNRDRSMRPLWYEECRIYLRERWNAKVIEGWEADDEISIVARELWKRQVPHVIATVDKDLDQIPGPHFDYGKKVWYHMDEEDALMFFYVQCICGDATDNIPGAWRIGKVKAETIIREAASDYYGMKHPEMSLEQWLWSQVVVTYAENMDKYPDKYVQDSPELVALENARLVKMQEYRGQLWTPPNMPDEVIDG